MAIVIYKLLEIDMHLDTHCNIHDYKKMNNKIGT